jgi:hypothetical protein
LWAKSASIFWPGLPGWSRSLGQAIWNLGVWPGSGFWNGYPILSHDEPMMPTPGERKFQLTEAGRERLERAAQEYIDRIEALLL